MNKKSNKSHSANQGTQSGKMTRDNGHSETGKKDSFNNR